MAPRVVVIGGGTDGIVVANRLARSGSPIEVVVLNGHDDYICQQGLVNVPTGRRYRPEFASRRDGREWVDLP